MEGTAEWWRRLTARPLAGDLVLVAVLLGAGIVSSRITVDLNAFSVPGYAGPSGWDITLAAVAVAGPLAVRRRLPELAALGTAAGFLLGRVVLESPEASVVSIAIAVALYSGAAHGGRFRHAANAVALAAVMARLWWEVTVGLPPIENVVLARAFLLVLNVALFLGAWALGGSMRRRRRDAEDLRDRARQLEEEREERARRAVFDERVRIARELHDVVAHHVSVMGIQAGAARRVLERQPDRAAGALATIEASSREAVTELDRLLGILRREGEADDRAPQPSLSDIGSLVDQTAGVAVSVQVEGEARPLPATVELSAYRIVQEALTNVRKHARATSADVLIHYGPTALEVRVVDDGRGGDGAQGGAGHGLIGMRERAQLHGGRLAAGPRPDGGFSVHATLPLDGDAP